MAVSKVTWIRILTPVISITLALFLAEGAARVLSIAAGRDRLIILDPQLGWVLRPGVKKVQTQEKQYAVEINSRGLREAEVGYERTPGMKRILVLGDSFAFGYGGVEVGERFSEFLESRHPDLEVINGGVPSYEPTQEYLFLKGEGLRYRPDLVLLTLFENDYDACFSPFDRAIGRPKGYVTLEGGDLQFHEPRFPWLYTLSQRTYLFGILDNRLGLRYYWGREPDPAISDQDKAAAYRLLISRIQQAAEDSGARFGSVYFPAPEDDPGTIPKLMVEIARQGGFPFEDLTPELASGPDRSPLYFATDLHFNAAGHALAGEIIDQRIVTPLLYAEKAVAKQ